MATIYPDSRDEQPEVYSSIIQLVVKQLQEGKFEVREIEQEQPADLNSGSRIPFSWSLAVFSVNGYIDPEDKEIAVWPSVVGIKIGDGYKGGFSSGIQILINLVAFSGSARFYVEGNTLKVQLNLKPLLPWSKSIDTTANILKF